MILPRNVTDPDGQATIVARWPAGKIVLANGKLIEIRCGIVSPRPSVARVWWANRLRRLPADHCVLHYRNPWRSRYLVLDYLATGQRTQLSTVLGAGVVLDEIARIRGAVAIFAHLSTDAISDRLLHRLGWQPHCPRAAGRHWIKRFYDGYPRHSSQRLQRLYSRPDD